MPLAGVRFHERFGELAAFYSGKNILVTGGMGYLATSLVALLRDIDCSVILLDVTDGSVMTAGGSATIQRVVGDVRERLVWEQMLDGIDVVFHFAAQTSAYAANQDPSSDLDINVMPMLHLLEVSRHRDVHPIVLFSSTVTIAGIPARLPVDETHPDSPLTIYDLHKLMAEQYLELYARLGIVKGAILRLANVYGPGPASSRSDRGVLNQMVRKAIAGESLTVYRPGDRLRDYVYVEDVALAFAQAACSIDRLNAEHFLIGSDQGHTLGEAIGLVAERVALRTGKLAPVVYVDPPAGLSPIEDRDFVADSHHFSRMTGWQARCSLVEGIDRTLEAFS
jgi:nucleoside-diphosphate-sugar epimerase